MYKSLLRIIFIFCLFSVPLFGQKKFKDSHQVLWVKTLSTSNDTLGFNYNLPIHFSGQYPVLNKKFTSSNYSYVFYVLRSTKPSEKIFSMYDSDELHQFYTDVIKSNLEVKVDLSFLEKGAIVNFNFYNKNFKNNKSKGILYLDNTYDKAATELYEILICNDCSALLMRNKIETYLAIKYGITLKNKDKYLSSTDVKIWDEHFNQAFNNNIIGLAKDTFFELEQIATSSNMEKEAVFKKSDNQAVMQDKTYVLVGDNNKAKTFDSQSGRLKRQWLVQNKGEHDLNIDLDLLFTPEKDIKYHLYTNYGDEIEHDQQDTVKLSFKNIKIATNTNYYLSIGKSKEFKFDIKEDTLGINNRYILTTNDQGEPPFHIQATDLSTNETHLFVTDAFNYILDNIPSSTYSFTVQDSKEQIAKVNSIALDFSNSNLFTLAENWQLEGRELIEIKPQIRKHKNQYGYRWYLAGKLISTAPSLRVNYAGTFQLEVTDLKGKYQTFGFTVSQKVKEHLDVDDSWYVSPNPVLSGQDFTVHYRFNSSKNVDFYIYTIDGKFIRRKKLGVIPGGDYTYQLAGRTSYLLISIINNKTSIQKLIVK